MDPTRAAVAAQLRVRLDMIRDEKERLIGCLRSREIEQDRLERELAEAFPEESLAPLVPFDELTLLERHVLHFIVRRGRIRRIPQILAAFTAMTGVVITEAGFRSHLTRLRDRGAVIRGHIGWVVAPEHAERAAEVPPPYRPPARTGQAALAKRVRGVQPVPSWRRRTPGKLAPGLQLVLDRMPHDRSITLAELAEGEGLPLSEAHRAVSDKLFKLAHEGLVVRVGYATYARSGVTLPTDPISPAEVPAGMLGVLKALPTQRAVSLAEWTRLALDSEAQEARDVMSARASVLVRAGLVERIGRGLFRQRPPGSAAAAPKAPTVSSAAAAAAVGALPKDLAAVLSRVGAREEKTLDQLEVECDGDPLVARGKLSGHVFRLCQRGLLERTGPRTYRRPRVHPEGDEDALLRHFRAGEVASVAELVQRSEGKLTASGLKRVRRVLEELEAGGRVEKVDGGWRGL